MIVVTGYKGFIGQNYVGHLINNTNEKCVYVVEKGDKFPELSEGDVVVHLGATTNTQAGWLECLTNNTLYTLVLYYLCKSSKAKLIYASSAAVYGNKGKPLNPYGWSKLLIDKIIGDKSVGLKFFNVYGPKEEHKGDMMSFVSKLKTGYDNMLFEDTQEHKRDYVFVGDVCEVIHFFVNNFVPGVYDVGTSKSISFKKLFELFKTQPFIIECPKKLVNKLQVNTRAKIRDLRNVGYKKKFKKVEEYV